LIGFHGFLPEYAKRGILHQSRGTPGSQNIAWVTGRNFCQQYGCEWYPEPLAGPGIILTGQDCMTIMKRL
jgi:hypothetical protein